MDSPPSTHRHDDCNDGEVSRPAQRTHRIDDRDDGEHEVVRQQHILRRVQVQVHHVLRVLDVICQGLHTGQLSQSILNCMRLYCLHTVNPQLREGAPMASQAADS